METDKTNKEILVKGLKKMGISLACMLLGPTFLHIALTNREKPLFIPILIFGIIICFLAMFFAFKGLMTIMDSIFKPKK
ncbi:DUF6095 family protein [Formosa sp. L2A11]|uniref:DUF6095 family protein n=1 Tax=Formosa sp. L2A11 TaxID=2686363 RepID=UPI00131CC3D3|nr:DUF6095 family protein [Formosa sp. L2A11]